MAACFVVLLSGIFNATPPTINLYSFFTVPLLPLRLLTLMSGSAAATPALSWEGQVILLILPSFCRPLLVSRRCLLPPSSPPSVLLTLTCTCNGFTRIYMNSLPLLGSLRLALTMLRHGLCYTFSSCSQVSCPNQGTDLVHRAFRLG